MQKVTINDFTGGIQESTVPNDFRPNQWAQLKGIIPNNEGVFESQWPIQTIGLSATGFQAVYPLRSSAGTFLVGIKTNGTLWWAAAPAASAAYTTCNAVTWTQLTTAQNYTAAGTAQESITSNTDYKFVTSVPLPVYKFAKTPSNATPANAALDTYTGSQIEVATGVLIHSTTLNGGGPSHNQQGIAAYVDTVSNSVKAVTFPNYRRTPIADAASGTYIRARVDTAGTILGYPAFLDNTPSRKFHPYTYTDTTGTLLPGYGIIPRCNTGTVKGGILILGDIEWRSDRTTIAPKPVTGYLASVEADDTVGSSDFYLSPTRALFPATLGTQGRVIYNEGPGIVFLKTNGNMTARIATYVAASGVATFTTSTSHGFTAGDTATITAVHTSLNGTYVITSTPSATSFTVAVSNSLSLALTTLTALGRVFAYNIRCSVGRYQVVPDAWSTIWVSATVSRTKIKAISNLNTAQHVLNDDTTGSHRGSIYFSTGGEIDRFDPRGVINIGKTDVAIAGIHVLNDDIIVITTAGTELDGVYKISGYLSRVIQYGAENNPGAIKVNLLRGGLGAPRRTTKVHKNYSVVWSESGSVVFIDRLGAIWYTNGTICERLDRFGPRKPDLATENDHVAEYGPHLFAWRNNRLLCFTLLSSSNGRAGEGCWTEINLSRGSTPFNIRSMVGSRDEVFFVATDTGNVMRMCQSAPNAERARVDNVPLTVTVSTLTAGDVSSHQRTNWHRFGMTFTTPTSCTVNTVSVQSTGALNITGAVSLPDVQYTTTLNRSYANPSIVGEFVVNAGIGPQAVCSATTTFTGYVQLQSASFWVTGQTPRVGDL